ncbi:MAG: winged helix-turn-helix domain-containing protein, partial [Halobacteriota archaeon]
ADTKKERKVDEPNSEIKSQEVEEILRLLACSDLRNNLAKALRNGKKMTLSELGEHVGASSPACVHALRELGKVHVTHQDEKRNYSLTNIGEIVTRKFEELNAAITTLSQNKEFWLDHDLSDIPKHLLDKIGSLADSTVLTSTPTDLFKSFSTLYTLLQNSKEIRAISPIFVEDMTAQFVKLVDKNIDIELIFTPDVLDATLRSADRKGLEKALESNLKLFKTENQPNFACTVTDYFLILGFFRPDGSFDWSTALLSYSPEALEWGQELFAYYVEKTEPIIL